MQTVPAESPLPSIPLSRSGFDPHKMVLAQRNTSNSSPDNESMTVAFLLCPEHNKQAGQQLPGFLSFFFERNCLVFSSHIMELPGFLFSYYGRVWMRR